ncbi:hypothetical protein HDV06_002519 [Boothiomyces sp. JEL0866]|nr:hypothetical protein HDV06_002519 [Boothiomyces sp. JEL0866]
MWSPITRPDRELYKMIREADFPSVDVYVVTYNEDEEIVDATVCAAANMQYPKRKLNIFVLDDGKRDNIKLMSLRIQSELESIGSRVKVTYCARPKVKGVNHHAKAGNINHCFTKLPQSKGDYVLILDCDMIVTKSFLLKTIPHFFELKNGKYVRKEKAAMLQIPQRFYNLGKNDPWWHTAEDFNAAGFEGSDGVGGTPCVGTGVLFRRECLLSLGGQSYWSVTEDFKTSFNLIGEGFSTMYLFRNLVFGIAVDDVVGIYKQRLRWSTGGLQILQYDNPLFKVGLPWAATSLFFCNAWQYVLCIPYLAVTIAPLVYFILGVSPVYTLLLETSIFVGGFILVTRCLQWWQVRLIQGSKDMALWRGCQQIVWLAPIFFHSLCQMIWLKTGKRVIEFIQRKTSHVEFVTSRKDGAKMPVTEILKANWFPLLAYLAFLFGIVWHVVRLALKIETPNANWILQWCLGFFLCLVVCMMLYPSFSDTFPILVREEKGFVSWEVDPKVVEGDLESNNITIEEQKRIVKAKAMNAVRNQVNRSTIDGEAYFKSQRNNGSTASFAESLAESVASSTTSSVIKAPVFHIVKQPSKVWKYRFLQGFMVIFAAVGLPLVAVFITGDTRV